MRAGGYSKFDLDLLVRYKTSNVLLDASVRSIEGIINPKNSSGSRVSIYTWDII